LRDEIEKQIQLKRILNKTKQIAMKRMITKFDMKMKWNQMSRDEIEEKIDKKIDKKNSNQKSKDQIWYKVKWNQIIREKIGKTKSIKKN